MEQLGLLLGMTTLALAAVGVLAGLMGLILSQSPSRRKAGRHCGAIAVIAGIPLLAMFLAQAPCFLVCLGLLAIGCGVFAIRSASRDDEIREPPRRDGTS